MRDRISDHAKFSSNAGCSNTFIQPKMVLALATCLLTVHAKNGYGRHTAYSRGNAIELLNLPNRKL